MEIYVTSTIHAISIFRSEKAMKAYARTVIPLEVLVSQHPTLEAATAFAKQLHATTPRMELNL